MKGIPIMALSNTKCGVGRFVSLTKLKIDWQLVLNNELLFLTLYDSSMSKTVRIALFDQIIAETNYSGSIFKVRVIIGRDEFYFLKKDSVYDLAINRNSFKKLPVSNDPKLDQRLIDSLPRFSQFTVARDNDGYVVQRKGTPQPPSPAPSPTQSPQSGWGSPQVQPQGVDLLNDSLEAYDHRFYFLPTADYKEDAGIVQFVNRPI